MNTLFTKILLGGFLAATIATSATAGTLDDIRSSGKIRVGMDENLRPYAYRNDSMELVGADVDAARKIADDLGVEFVPVPLTSPNRIPFLVTEKVDIVVSTLAKTPERQKVIDFTRPYSGSVVVAVAPADLDISSMQDLAGKTIGVTRGTSYDHIITEEAPKSTDIVRFDGEDTALTALGSGQTNIGAFSIALLPALNAAHPDKDFEAKFVVQQVLFTIGVRKGDEELKSWLNDWIAKHLADGSLNAFYKKYIGSDLPDAIATTE